MSISSTLRRRVLVGTAAVGVRPWAPRPRWPTRPTTSNWLVIPADNGAAMVEGFTPECEEAVESASRREKPGR